MAHGFTELSPCSFCFMCLGRGSMSTEQCGGEELCIFWRTRKQTGSWEVGRIIYPPKDYSPRTDFFQLSPTSWFPSLSKILPPARWSTKHLKCGLVGSTSESSYNYRQKKWLTSHLLGHLERWVDGLFSVPLSWNKIVYKGKAQADKGGMWKQTRWES